MALLVPLGAAIVSSPGTPVPLVSTSSAGYKYVHNSHSFIVQALPTNAGIAYLLSNSSAADTTNYTNVCYCLTAAGAAFGQGSTAVNDLDISTLYVDASAASCGVLVNLVVS